MLNRVDIIATAYVIHNRWVKTDASVVADGYYDLFIAWRVGAIASSLSLSFGFGAQGQWFRALHVNRHRLILVPLFRV